MNKIVISEVNIIPVTPKNGLVAFASCIFNGCLSLNSIAIYTLLDGSGHRLVYPNRVLPTGKEINLFFPINKGAGQEIEEAIVKVYEDLLTKLKKSEERNGANFC